MEYSWQISLSWPVGVLDLGNMGNYLTYTVRKAKKGDVSKVYSNYYCNGNNQRNIDIRQSYHSSALTDYGPNPFIVDINKATLQNNTFRTALWTGKHLQLTLMSIPAGGDIGAEMHPNVDQFLRVEDGQGVVQTGDSRERLYLRQPVFDDFAIFIPAGTWHNITNTGNKPLKLYSIYAPPNHPWGTIHQTKEIAEEMER